MSKGHNVYYWGMKHPQNYQFEYQDSFVDFIDYVDLNKKKNVTSAFRVLSRSIYSLDARNKLGKFIDEIHPDVVHLNNIHAHLTPSIVDAINLKGIPIMWTLHDFKLLCPESHFLSNDKICEKCKGKRFYNCLLNTCKKGSFSASLIATIEAYAHQCLALNKKIKFFLAPSRFLRNKFVENGWAPDKMIFLHNFLSELGKINYGNNSGYLLYFGGLSPWKGINTLIDAMKGVKRAIKLKIVGQGNYKNSLMKYVQDLGINNVEFCGYMTGEDLTKIIEDSLFVLVPSECYENCPFSIMEAMSYGKPVIGSDIGGIPELVKDGVTGLLFQPGDAGKLANKINWLIDHPDKIYEFSRNASVFANREFDSTNYYNRLMSLYKKALE